MKTLYLTSLLIFFLVIKDQSPNPDSRSAIEFEPPHQWKLLPESKGVVLDISHAEVQGKWDKVDRDEILLLVGRIKTIQPYIKEIVIWGDSLYTPAVRITDGNNMIVYVVQLANHRWAVSEAIKVYR